MIIKTADNQTIEVGHKAYDYYADRLDDSAVVIFSRLDTCDDKWGIWTHQDGTGMILRDGSRVCSMRHANTMGWLSNDAYAAHLDSLSV